MTTMPITFNQIHVVLDALSQHAERINDDAYDPTRIYEGGGEDGVFPTGHPLRNIAEYVVLLDALLETFNDALAAAGEESAINIAIEG